MFQNLNQTYSVVFSEEITDFRIQIPTLHILGLTVTLEIQANFSKL